MAVASAWSNPREGCRAVTLCSLSGRQGRAHPWGPPWESGRTGWGQTHQGAAMLRGVWEERRVRVPGGGGCGDHAEGQGGQVPGVLLEGPRAGWTLQGRGCGQCPCSHKQLRGGRWCWLTGTFWPRIDVLSIRQRVCEVGAAASLCRPEETRPQPWGRGGCGRPGGAWPRHMEARRMLHPSPPPLLLSGDCGPRVKGTRAPSERGLPAPTVSQDPSASVRRV